MSAIAELGAFILVVCGLFLIPGPAVLLLVTRSAQAGAKTGIITGLGIATGDFIHVLLAAVGISAILMTSPAAFTVIKIAGAAYLICMGIQAFSAKASPINRPVVIQSSFPKIYWHGLLVEAVNPKTALFFLALFPQFVHPESGSIITQFLLLGVVFVGLTVIYTTGLAVFTGTVSQLIDRGTGMNRWGHKALGLLYICLGLQVVFLSP
ncbi:LysE family translocator [Planomicrobium sp. CPCC 101110]|uniref:LysE family translocator n=1 Tax=Planomicrobium sp. CPCC 101110 TaxID=2599619 RepID=UPI0011B6CC56|nr:LysE family translocator [Planomicrobium sp. CPCC 101110]TWT26055.1 LysE family translocator [Planomicrobium sp. CPCC 101110]